MRVETHEVMDVSLRGMKWVDANYDGTVSSVDPVWRAAAVTQVNGQNVNVSFTYNADGTRTAHVNSINGMPALNQAENDGLVEVAA